MAIGIIVGIVLVLFCIAAFVVASVCFDSDRTGGGVTSVIVGCLLVLAIILVPFSFHTVDTGEIAVVKHLGKIEGVRTPGTSFDLWVTNSYIKYDAKVQNTEIQTIAYSSDAQTMDISLTFQYKIMPDRVVDIASQYGTLEALSARIQSIAIEQTKAALSKHKAMDIIANRALISPEVEQAIMNAIGDDYFVNVATVVITNIDFSDAFEQAVEDKMIAEQAKLKAEYENEKRVAAAKAEAAAKLEEAQAAIEIAKAEAEALKIVSEAEAAANKILAESLTDEVLIAEFYERWDGKLPVVMGNGEYILSPDLIMGD